MTLFDTLREQNIQTTCCISGGGPAGMMLGFLLARAGVEVTVLEKHADFLRDFRGDTIHPSTLELMKELGLLEAFLARPHQKIYQLQGVVEGQKIIVADFSHLEVACPYIALMPQWDFLNFLAEQARKYPSFHLRMQAEATGFIEEDGRITGITARTPEGLLKINALLSIGADGRHSALREKAGLRVEDSGAPIDVLWMRLSRKPDDPDQPLGNFDRGRAFVMIYRGDYWQCAYVIAKGGYDAIRSRGLDRFREDIAAIAPFMRNRVEELASWEDIKLLTVAVDHLPRWSRPGFLCIGDAAHAMSPVGGVGINLAVQDAVAAANRLAGPLKSGHVKDSDLRGVQRRRAWPARLIQRIQIFIHAHVFGSIGRNPPRRGVPLVLKLFSRIPFLRRIPAYIVGIGFRPEHIR